MGRGKIYCKNCKYCTLMRKYYKTIDVCTKYAIKNFDYYGRLIKGNGVNFG